MAHAPYIKVYNAAGEYLASFKYEEDAAVLVAALGDGASIRIGHSKRSVVWTEGKETQSAGESYDHVATTIRGRVEAWKSL